MLSIILCSHAGLAEGLKSSAEMICGELRNVKCITFNEQTSLEGLKEQIKKEYDLFAAEGNKVIVLVDLPGATPFNCCAEALAGTDTMIITGMSLPVLLEILMERENVTDCRQYVPECVENAKESLTAVDMSEF